LTRSVRVLTSASRALRTARSCATLWLVPSNVIKDQTLAALRTLNHPYRQALQASLGGGPITVMDLAEALYIQRSVLDGETCVIVSTLAALRVENTDGRKVYETAGALQHHFTGLSADLDPSSLFAPQAVVTVSKAPDTSILPEALRKKVSFDGEKNTITLTGPMEEDEKEALKRCVSAPEDHASIEALYVASKKKVVTGPLSPAQRGELLVILTSTSAGRSIFASVTFFTRTSHGPL
jgi:hypothetical protein